MTQFARAKKSVPVICISVLLTVASCDLSKTQVDRAFTRPVDPAQLTSMAEDTRLATANYPESIQDAIRCSRVGVPYRHFISVELITGKHIPVIAHHINTYDEASSFLLLLRLRELAQFDPIARRAYNNIQPQRRTRILLAGLKVATTLIDWSPTGPAGRALQEDIHYCVQPLVKLLDDTTRIPTGNAQESIDVMIAHVAYLHLCALAKIEAIDYWHLQEIWGEERLRLIQELRAGGLIAD